MDAVRALLEHGAQIEISSQVSPPNFFIEPQLTSSRKAIVHYTMYAVLEHSSFIHLTVCCYRNLSAHIGSPEWIV